MKNKRNARLMRFAGAAALSTMLFVGTGCLVSAHSHTDESGMRITSSTLDQIELGQTNEAWLIATLGEPTTRTDVQSQPGVQILRYDYVRNTSDSGHVFLLLSASDHSVDQSTTFFEVTNSVVTRFWTENN